MYKRRSENWTKHLDFILLDAVCLVMSLFLAYYAYYRTFNLFVDNLYRNILILLILIDIFAALLLNTMHHVMHRGYFIEFSQTIKQVLLVFGVEVLLLFVMKWSGTYSRVILSLTALFHLILSYSTRLLWKRAVRLYSGQREKRSMILVCAEQDVETVLARRNSEDEAQFSGIVLTDRNATGETVCGFWSLEGLRHEGAIVVSGPMTIKRISPKPEIELEQGTVAALVDACRQMAVPIHIRVPLGGHKGRSFVENVNGFNVVTMAANYASPLQLFLKRLLDLLGGLIGSIFALLIVLIIGPMIRKKSPASSLRSALFWR